ncbi:MAG: flagellar hook-basal body complex protein FliE [Burkholderiaceae bacterium]
MDINSIDQLKAALEATTRSPGKGAQDSVASPASSFGSALDKALTQVSEVQAESRSNQQAYQRGEPGVSLEQTMVSMQKSQVAFQAALTVRNRLVAAYTDIMNMQV